METSEKSWTLLQLLNGIKRLVEQPGTQNLWVVAELQDVSERGGHCYMELLQKDDGGRQLAKARGCIWASNYHRIKYEFLRATGQPFATGLKVLVRASVSFSPIYGLSLVISEVNPEFTMGDLLRRRMEILRRLKEEGVIDMNRELEWPLVPQRIAVISAPQAAGYGDFMNQLYNSKNRLRFTTRLFEARMQGESAPSQIVAALERIAEEADKWDGVVIIRGGGATSDLQAFEDYNLAAAVAQFPLPIAIGIGHERDVTVLDYVANKRLKTPTAVAEWLISTGDDVLGRLATLGAQILQTATDRITGDREQLAHAEGLLPLAVRGALDRARHRLVNASGLLSGVSGRLIEPQRARLNMTLQAIATAAQNAIARQRTGLDATEKLLDALSPAATLKRGYSITRVNGHAVMSVDEITPGAEIETTLADGSFKSTAQ